MKVGFEFIDNVRQTRSSKAPTLSRCLPRISNRPAQLAFYGEDEVKLKRWMIVNGGLRYDGYGDFQRVTPRAALIFLPSSTQSVKYLFGRAFRAPSAYEANTALFGDQVRTLEPETIDTHELVWERYINDWLRTSVSSYWYKAEQLITQVVDDSAYLHVVVNQAKCERRAWSSARCAFEERRRWSPALQSATERRPTPNYQILRAICSRCESPSRTDAAIVRSLEEQALEQPRTAPALAWGSSHRQLHVVQPVTHSWELFGWCEICSTSTMRLRVQRARRTPSRRTVEPLRIGLRYSPGQSDRNRSERAASSRRLSDERRHAAGRHARRRCLRSTAPCSRMNCSIIRMQRSVLHDVDLNAARAAALLLPERCGSHRRRLANAVEEDGTAARMAHGSAA